MFLVERHFAMQGERPPHLREVAVEELDPFLRTLLFTDGTVTRALGAQTLAPVTVERIGQAPVRMPAEIAACLEAPEDEETIRRRVGIGVGRPPLPALWAESFMIPDRLPPGFFSLLEAAPDGIGQSLQRVNLDSSRELCWFGLDAVPDWAPTAADGPRTALHRRYRIVSGGAPAIVISESFAVEWRRNAYGLAAVSTDSYTHPPAEEGQ